jgi:hypothetical protein
LVPPDERFWQRYSPRHELPLAGATSLFAHGMVVALLAVGGVAFFFRESAEAQRPAQMEVLLVEAGDGFGGPGGAPGLPGLPGEEGKTELPPGPFTPGPMGEAGAEETPDLPPIPGTEFELPTPDRPVDPGTDLLDELKKLSQDADKRSQPLVKVAAMPKAASGTKSGGGGGPKGAGGQAGQGGVGGSGKGLMGGQGSGAGGRKPTDQEVKAWRWRFDLVGSAKEHADKLDRAGLIVAVPDPKADKFDPENGPYLFITDLKRRPVKLEPGDIAKYKDAVKWGNAKPDSVRSLATELKLNFAPPRFVLLLPKDREMKMAAEEARYAKEHRTDIARVTETWFDFRLKNGVYEPVVIMQK